MWDIDVSPEAWEDLQWFRKHDQARILATIKDQLRHQPDLETRNRKRLRPGHRSEWELRIGINRVFYDLDQPALLVKIMAIGLKERKQLFFRGQEYSP